MRFKDKIAFVLFFFALLFISLNRHSRHPLYSYHSQLFADKAGYQVYLPAFFYYDMDANKMPIDILEKTGNGFRFEGNKIITKYPIGVAFFQAPFFAISAVLDSWNGAEKYKGFTVYQQQALNWATALFAVLGLLILFLTAIRYWGLSYGKAYLLIIALLLCSNLLYYSTRDCGMSHAYSFFVFAAIQYLFIKCLRVKTIFGRDLICLAILFSLLITLRPLNLVFVAVPLTYILLTNWNELRALEIKFNKVTFILACLIALIPITLQGLYNNYAFGSFITDSYAEESFSNFFSMDLIALWFSPNNGALLHSPIIIAALVWRVFQLRAKKPIAAIYFLYFLLISFTYASWWSPGLGCGFGHRGFTEHLAFFALPISQNITPVKRWKLTLAWIIVLGIGIALFIAQLNFDGCVHGEIWEWTAFFKLFRL